MSAWTRQLTLLSGFPFKHTALANLVQDQLDKFKLRLPVDVFEVDVAGPGIHHVVIFRQINGLANTFDGFDIGPGSVDDLHLRSEPLRVCRRLQLLRGWSYDTENIGKIFT